MNPDKDRPKTRKRPGIAAPLGRPRSNPEAPHRGLSEDHEETSMRPVGVGSDENLARDLPAPCKSPDQNLSETSDGPLLPETVGSPGRDRVGTSAILRRALTCPAARSPASNRPRTASTAVTAKASPSRRRSAHGQAARAAAPGGPRTISRNEKLSYGARTFRVSGCQRLQQQGAGAQLLEGSPRHGMSRLIDGRDRGAGRAPGHRSSAAEWSRQGPLGVRSLHSNESEESP